MLRRKNLEKATKQINQVIRSIRLSVEKLESANEVLSEQKTINDDYITNLKIENKLINDKTEEASKIISNIKKNILGE